MAITRVKTWVNGEILTHTDLNAEFDNILNNALSLVSPWTANMAAGGFRLTGLGLGTVASPSLQFTGDTDTGIYSGGADIVAISVGGAFALTVNGPTATATVAVVNEDARTNSVYNPFIIQSTTTGSPAAGIGTGMLFKAESADENPCTFGSLSFSASDITAGSEDTQFDIALRVAGVASETKYRFLSTAATGFQVDITHGVTADRVITIPDATTTLVGTDASQALSNKAITTLTETFTTGDVLTLAESGKTCFLNAAGGFTLTLPAVTTAGTNFTFIVKTAPNPAYIILSATNDNIIGYPVASLGSDETANGSADGDQLNFVATVALPGDSAQFVSDGAFWYVRAICKATGAITITG